VVSDILGDVQAGGGGVVWPALAWVRRNMPFVKGLRRIAERAGPNARWSAGAFDTVKRRDKNVKNPCSQRGTAIE